MCGIYKVRNQEQGGEGGREGGREGGEGGCASFIREGIHNI